MNNASLIPPEHKPLSSRERVRGLLLGLIVGAVIAFVAWWVFGDSSWLFTVPLCGVLGWWAAERIHPNVLWGHRDL
jgi:uncharacterized membrane protein YccC